MRKVLVFDEPTAVLTPQETDELMEIMRQLKASGASIVFITHKLREVREVADRITVIRLGKVVGEASPTASNAELASMMVGRAVELTVHKDAPRASTITRSSSKNLSVIDAFGHIVVNDVSFDVRGGEILAIAGVQGNGQTELAEALIGLQPLVRGSAKLDGEELVGRSVRRILDEGVGFVPEDRTEDGLVGAFTIAENLMLDRANGEPFVKAWNVQRQDAQRLRATSASASSTSARRASTPRSPRCPAATSRRSSSPANSAGSCRCFVAAQPTRGVDVGSIEFIHKRIVETRDAGVPVIVVSTELDEVTALADRIMVMYRGRIVGIVPGDTPRDVLGLMMAGEPVAGEGAAA